MYSALSKSVAEPLAQVEALIQKELKTIHSELGKKISEYLIVSGGKRVRPLICLLIAGACGKISKQHTMLAAAIELIHTASLIHDDIIDNASVRRNKPTANRLWGNSRSILTGDLLYSRSFALLAKIQDLELLQGIIEASEHLASGELNQLDLLYQTQLSEEAYFEIIYYKTAVLFQAATIGVAKLSKTPQWLEAADHYGKHYGMMFQLHDDLLDYTGHSQNTGKALGTDLSEGKITLPLIHALQHANNAQLKRLQHIVNQQKQAAPDTEACCDPALLEEVLSIMRNCGSLDYTNKRIEHHRQQAISALNSLQPSVYTQNLEELLTVLLNSPQ